MWIALMMLYRKVITLKLYHTVGTILKKDSTICLKNCSYLLIAGLKSSTSGQSSSSLGKRHIDDRKGKRRNKKRKLW
jgi:hypothetical protein